MTCRRNVTRVSDVRAEFAGKSIDVDGDESDNRIWVRERGVVNSEEVGRKDGGGTIEDGKLASFREMKRVQRRGLCNIECVA